MHRCVYQEVSHNDWSLRNSVPVMCVHVHTTVVVVYCTVGGVEPDTAQLRGVAGEQTLLLLQS